MLFNCKKIVHWLLGYVIPAKLYYYPDVSGLQSKKQISVTNIWILFYNGIQFLIVQIAGIKKKIPATSSFIQHIHVDGIFFLRIIKPVLSDMHFNCKKICALVTGICHPSSCIIRIFNPTTNFHSKYMEFIR